MFEKKIKEKFSIGIKMKQIKQKEAKIFINSLDIKIAHRSEVVQKMFNF